MIFTRREQAIINYHLLFSICIPLSTYIIFQDTKLIGYMLCFSFVMAIMNELLNPDLFYGLISKRKLSRSLNTEQNNRTDSGVYKISRIFVIYLTITGILLHSATDSGIYTVYSIVMFLFLSFFFLGFAPYGATYFITQVHEITRKSTPNQYGYPNALYLAAVLYTVFIMYFYWSSLEMIRITKYLY